MILTWVLEVCVGGRIMLGVILISVAVLMPVTDQALGVEGVLVHF